MKKRKFFKKEKPPFRKAAMICHYRNKQDAEGAVSRLREEGIPAEIIPSPPQIADDGAATGESYTLCVWDEFKKQALQTLKIESSERSTQSAE